MRVQKRSDGFLAVAIAALFAVFRITKQHQIMETLHLTYTPHRYCGGGILKPADHESQRLALKHFSAGSVVIGYERLDEIIYIAGLHGWKVTTEGVPNHSLENASVEAHQTSMKKSKDSAALPLTNCSASWFLNGAEYRERNGYIEARNELNTDWVVVNHSHEWSDGCKVTPHQKERDNGKLILECCEVVGGSVLSISHLEACLEAGAKIEKQDGQWHLFAADENGIKCRDTLSELLTDLPPLNAKKIACEGEL